MKVEIHRESFLSALSAVSGIVPTRSPKAILQNVKFVVGDLFTPDSDGPTLMANDLEIGISCRVRNVKVIESGAVILPPVRLNQILSKADCDTLTIELDGDTVKIRGRKVKYDLPSEDASLFPDPPTFKASSYHTVPAADLARLIGRTVFAVDLETTRYALGGVMTELYPDTITMIATDGRRLAEAKAPAEVVGSPDTYANRGKEGVKQAPIVPVKALTTLKKVLGKALPTDPPVAISIQDYNRVLSSITYQTERVTISTRVVEGRFPQYQDVFPGGVGTLVEMAAGPFREAVEQAAIATSEETKGVDFHFTAGRLELTAQATDVGKSEIEMDLPGFDGPETKVTFDPSYLLDALRAMGDDEAIRADFRDKEGNVFRVGDDYVYCAMPLTRDR